MSHRTTEAGLLTAFIGALFTALGLLLGPRIHAATDHPLPPMAPTGPKQALWDAATPLLGSAYLWPLLGLYATVVVLAVWHTIRKDQP